VEKSNSSLTSRGGELQLTGLTNNNRLTGGAFAVSCFPLPSVAFAISVLFKVFSPPARSF
jgi:hypothetical protein